MNRQALLFASLVGDDFRSSRQLTTNPEMTLKGEDGRKAGWLGDRKSHAKLRGKVRRRIDVGETKPTILFGGSGDDKRMLKAAKPDDTEPGELEIVREYLIPGVEPLYPDIGLVEEDYMIKHVGGTLLDGAEVTGLQQ